MFTQQAGTGVTIAYRYYTTGWQYGTGIRLIDRLYDPAELPVPVGFISSTVVG